MLLITHFDPNTVIIGKHIITMHFHPGDIIIEKEGRPFVLETDKPHIILNRSNLEIDNTHAVIVLRFGNLNIKPNLFQLMKYSDIAYQIRRYFSELGDEPDIEPQFDLIHELEARNIDQLIDKALEERDVNAFDRLTSLDKREEEA